MNILFKYFNNDIYIYIYKLLFFEFKFDQSLVYNKFILMEYIWYKQFSVDITHLTKMYKKY